MPYRHVYCVLVLVPGWTLACAADDNRPVPARAAAPDTRPTAASPAPGGATRPATRPAWPVEEPVLSYWRDANYLLNAPAVPLFVAWEDGTVLVRFQGKPYRGQLPRAEVAALLKEARDAGLFDPPVKRPVARPDGPSKTLFARDGERRTRASYDGVYDGADAFDRIGPTASPTREQVVAFVTMWHRTVRATFDVAPERLDRAEEPPLKHPAGR